jgi:hypothetical protein
MLLRHQGFVCLYVLWESRLPSALADSEQGSVRKEKQKIIRKEKITQSNQCFLAQYFNAKLSYPTFQSSAAR